MFGASFFSTSSWSVHRVGQQSLSAHCEGGAVRSHGSLCRFRRVRRSCELIGMGRMSVAAAVTLLLCASCSAYRAAPTSSRMRSRRPCLRVPVETPPPPPTPKSSHGGAAIEPKEWFGLPRETVAQPLGTLLAAQLVLFVGVGAVIPVLPLYGREIGLSSAVSGLVISAPAVALLLGARFAGEYADRARKPAMLIGMGAIVISDLGTAFSTTLYPLLLARLGLGAGRALSESGERGMLADLAARAPTLRGRALAAQSAVSALGIAIGAPLGGIAVDAYGPRAAFVCVSIAAALAMVAYTVLPETVGSAIHTGDGSCSSFASAAPSNATDDDASAAASADVTSTAASAAASDGRWLELLRDESWRGLALCEAGARFGFAAKLTSVPLLAADTLGGPS